MTPSNEKAAGGGAVELPPLPKSTACLWVTDNPRHCSLLRPAPNVVNAFPWPADSKTEADRDYWRAKGFWQEPLFTAAQMDDHAESALKLQADRIAELEKDAARLDALDCPGWVIEIRCVPRTFGVGFDAVVKNQYSVQAGPIHGKPADTLRAALDSAFEFAAPSKPTDPKPMTGADPYGY